MIYLIFADSKDFFCHLILMTQTIDQNYFPQNYKNSREIFKARVESLQTQKIFGEWAIPGKNDHDLFVDHVWFPPIEKAETLFVLTSGIHGSETYAGAAIQGMFLNEIFPHIDRSRTGILVVHSMNPFGFKHHQRCTEAGVNLNRNFSVSGENFKKLNKSSAQLCERFLERKPVHSMRSSVLEKISMKDSKPFIEEISLDEFTKGVSPGQFENVKNWEFGGHKTEPQTMLLIEKLRELMPAFKNVIGFDLHTGLGDSKRLHLLTDVPGKSLDKTLFSELIRPEQDIKYYEFTPPETEGFYPVFGALNSAFGDLAAANQRVCSLTMEFGTLGHSIEAQIAGLNSFVLAHQGYYYGFANQEIEKHVIKENFERSRPDDKVWESEVIKASRGLFLNVFDRIRTGL